MKKIGIFLLLIFTLFAFTNCFDVVEKIKINKNGSGSFTFIINASQSKTRLNSVIKMGSFNGKEIPSKGVIYQDITKIKNAVASTEGISNVKADINLEEYIVKISGDFKNIEYLDNAIRKVKSENKFDDNFPTNWYTYTDLGKTFKKNTLPSYGKQYSEMNASDKKIFSEATYTSILQFDNPIKAISNQQYEMSTSNTSLKNSGKIIDFINQKKKPEITVHLN